MSRRASTTLAAEARGPRSETGADSVKDESVLSRIERLAEEEQRLYREDNLSADDVERLEEIKAELDRCWDLLRRRRARREFGRDPDGAKVPE